MRARARGLWSLLTGRRFVSASCVEGIQEDLFDLCLNRLQLQTLNAIYIHILCRTSMKTK